MTTPALDGISEQDFQNLVIDYAQLRGWLVHHTRPAINRNGKWSTPIQGNIGFPDLVLARNGHLILAELKSQKGQPTPKQIKWLHSIDKGWLQPLSETPVRAGRLWRPSDWPEIEQVLR